MRILHLDDDRSILRAIERQLRGLAAVGGFSQLLLPAIVDGATDLTAAIGLIQVNQYDLVISDYDLGQGTTGADLLAWVKVNRPDLRFMFLSANAAVHTLGVPFAEKPCTKQELVAAILETIK